MAQEEGRGFIARLREGLARTRQGLAGRVQGLLQGRKAIEEDLYEDLEEVLIQADLGLETTMKLMAWLRERVQALRLTDPEALLPLLKDGMAALLEGTGPAATGIVNDGLWPPPPPGGGPAVVMMVGVNGSGKTTTTGKLACQARAAGRRVVLAAADTFRAAAADQLAAWADRAEVDMVRHGEGADPAAVAFDAVEAARARGADLVIVDTAGRLHTKANLMEELKKIHRVIGRALPGAPHHVCLVLDATTGQNALQQARLFADTVGVNGIILTKMDGTAKGGIILAIKNNLGIDVIYIGIGEGVDDLRPFDPATFLDAVFEG